MGWRRLLASLSIALVGPAASAMPGKSYEHFLIGDPKDVTRTVSRASRVVLMGGGRAVEEAFRWMIDKGKGGNFVVIRAAGTDAYNDYIHRLGGSSSVETIVIPDQAAANDEFVVRRVRAAEALLIAGGDQHDYVKHWHGSRLQKAIQALAEKGVPIAGNSAGLAVLGEHAFSAEFGSIRSGAALADPFHERITFSLGFLKLPYLRGVITDSHFDTRDRMGRLVVFMSRLLADTRAKRMRGIGVDVATALMVENRWAEMVGEGAVHFLEMTTPPEAMLPDVPLTHAGVRVERLAGPGRFDMRRWTGVEDSTVRYSISVVDGVLRSGEDERKPD